MEGQNIILNFIVFILSTAGLTRIVVRGKLFEWLRELLAVGFEQYCITDKEKKSGIVKEKKSNIFKKFFYWFFFNLLTCETCFGFWASIIILSMIYFNLQIICYPFAGALMAVLLNKTITGKNK